MSSVVTAIWGIGLLIVLLGSIPYGIWMIYTAFKRKWRKLGLQFSIPIVVFILLLGVTTVVDRLAHDQYLNNLYDADVSLGRPTYEYDSERSFQGDGYSISVYNLPREIRVRFENADQNLLSDFPKLPSYRDRWSAEPWSASPLNEDHRKYLDFALMGGDDSTIVYSAALRKALSRKGAYYSFFYYDHGDHPGNVDFFVVDLEGDRLYVMNMNT